MNNKMPRKEEKPSGFSVLQTNQMLSKQVISDMFVYTYISYWWSSVNKVDWTVGTSS